MTSDHDSKRYSYGDGDDEIDWGSCDEDSNDSHNDSGATFSIQSLLNQSEDANPNGQAPEGLSVQIDLPRRTVAR